MKFVTRLLNRFSGNYRRSERIDSVLVLKEIERLLSQPSGISDELRGYLSHWPSYLRNMKKVSDLSVYIGGSLARKFFGLRREETYASPETRYAWMKKSFSENAGYFSFNGMKIPLPDGGEDELQFLFMFQEILFPSMITPKVPVVTSFFDDAEEYEHDDAVTLHDGDIVFDAGANSGFFASLASSKGCRVFSFEPSKHIRDKYLEKTAALNPNITVLPYALSDEAKQLRFFTSYENMWASRISSGEDASGAKGAYDTIDAVTVDEVAHERNLERVDFIKADIEGAEREMLKGARGVLRDFAPRVAICTYHLPDDPEVIRGLLLDAQPKYKIIEGRTKFYAYV